MQRRVRLRSLGRHVIGFALISESAVYWVILLVVSGSILISVYMVARKARGTIPIPYTSTRVRPLKPPNYDVARFKVFEDALASIVLGAGARAPRLHVAYMLQPLAFCVPASVKPLSFVIEHPLDIALATSLLEVDFKKDEVEAIVANLLARTVLRPWSTISTWSNVESKAEEVGLPRALPIELFEEFGPNSLIGFTLIADAWAARLTGRPGSMRSAIIKSRDLLNNWTTYVGPADPFTFVDIVHGCEYQKPLTPKEIRFWGDGGYLTATLDMGRKRDRVLEFRIKSLEMIEQGAHQPHQEVRDGRPITGPEGWE